jgi:hypothetical protein
MPTCPEGHDTPSTDFCDVCGIRVGAPMPAPPPSAADLIRSAGVVEGELADPGPGRQAHHADRRALLACGTV